MKLFDRSFGKDFLETVPTAPAVYFIHDESERLIYVGKAKNLRRRLSQYRNTRRIKKHKKMREIVRFGKRISWQECSSDLEACLRENEWIQKHRPKFNIAGAFYFLYPMIGIRAHQGFLYFCYTAKPELFPEYRLHGAYRSREVTWEGMHALVTLLKYVGHPMPRKSIGPVPQGGYVYGFRQIPDSWVGLLEDFLRGESMQAMEDLVLALVENAGARRARKDVQDHLDALKRFWKHEAKSLKKARSKAGFDTYPVPQTERDRIFLKAKMSALSDNA